MWRTTLRRGLKSSKATGCSTLVLQAASSTFEPIGPFIAGPATTAAASSTASGSCAPARVAAVPLATAIGSKNTRVPSSQPLGADSARACSPTVRYSNRLNSSSSSSGRGSSQSDRERPPPPPAPATSTCSSSPSSSSFAPATTASLTADREAWWRRNSGGESTSFITHTHSSSSSGTWNGFARAPATGLAARQCHSSHSSVHRGGAGGSSRRGRAGWAAAGVGSGVRVLDGRHEASEWQRELAGEVAALRAALGRPPGLAVVLVGQRPDSLLYVSRKLEACSQVGVTATLERLPGSVTQAELEGHVARLCSDPDVDGVLVQLPLPAGLDEDAVIDAFDPSKDVDGFHPLNVGRMLQRGREDRFIPCAALGTMELLRRSGIKMEGLTAVVLGDSNIVGMPLSMLLREEGVGAVTVCHRIALQELFRGNTPSPSSLPSMSSSSSLSPSPSSSSPSLSSASSPSCSSPPPPSAPTPPPSPAAPGGGASASASSSLSSSSPPGPAVGSAEARAEADACVPQLPGPGRRSMGGDPAATSSPSAPPLCGAAVHAPPRGGLSQQQQHGQTRGGQEGPGMVSPLGAPAALPAAPPPLPGHLDLPTITRTADILVVAVGYPQLIRSDWVKPGAVVVDVGVNVVAGAESFSHCRPGERPQDYHVVGDVDFDDVATVASVITPVPGGVGPMTIAAVLHNVLQSARYRLGMETY